MTGEDYFCIAYWVVMLWALAVVWGKDDADSE